MRTWRVVMQGSRRTCLYPIRASSRSSSLCIVAMLPLTGWFKLFVYDGGRPSFSVDARRSAVCTISMIVVNASR